MRSLQTKVTSFSRFTDSKNQFVNFEGLIDFSSNMTKLWVEIIPSNYKNAIWNILYSYLYHDISANGFPPAALQTKVTVWPSRIVSPSMYPVISGGPGGSEK